MGDRLSQYVISSYTPTVSALLGATGRVKCSSFKLLSVIEPSPPGESEIPNTEEELRRIRYHIPDQDHAILEGPQATRAKVKKAMGQCSWIHLACHGVQKPIEPTKSALLLHDGHLTLEEIIKLDLPEAEFAFLSACQTTAGDDTLSEEAVHIAGGMLLCGYRSVVATMWSIKDELAPDVADEFYAFFMQEEGKLDNRKTAEALHNSIQKLMRRNGISFVDCIPFVHLGT
jgi:CHAT domain-containing protein